MNHIIKRKIDEKDLEHAKARGAVIILMEEIIGTMNLAIESGLYDLELIAFQYGDLISKITAANTLVAQKNTLEALTIYED